MKITKFDGSRLRNHEHVQFHSETKGLIDLIGVDALKIGQLYPNYSSLLASEEAALRIVAGSELTAQIIEADAERDALVRGLKDAVKSGLNHFVAAKQAAADRIWHTLSSFGDIPSMPNTEETAAIKLLIADGATTLSADIALLGLGEWFTELATRNSTFEALVTGRDNQKTAQPDLNVRAVRSSLDEAFRSIVERINALAIVQGPVVFAPFIAKINTQIERYMLLLKSRKPSGDAKPAATAS